MVVKIVRVPIEGNKIKDEKSDKIKGILADIKANELKKCVDDVLMCVDREWQEVVYEWIKAASKEVK